MSLLLEDIKHFPPFNCQIIKQGESHDVYRQSSLCFHLFLVVTTKHPTLKKIKSLSPF